MRPGLKPNTPKLPATRRIPVQVSGRNYDIVLRRGGTSGLDGALRDAGLDNSQVMVFTSPTVGGLYYDTLKRALEKGGKRSVSRHDIPDGEEHKNFAEYERCVRALATFCPDPANVPLVIVLGGGVLGDVGGFAAGTFRRGVPLVQMPTTLLSCVDSAIGGKTGIDFAAVKNLLGLIYQPRLVFEDLNFLKSLPAREVRSGMAEVIKYGAVLSADFFSFLEKNIEALLRLEPSVLDRVVLECCEIKAKIVREDEHDSKGVRAVLNFGHTVGHALEMAAMACGKPITHGEGVAVGMLAATELSERLRLCSNDVFTRLSSLIERSDLPTSIRGLRADAKGIIKIMRHDKKAAKGKLRFVLPTKIGGWRFEEVDAEGLVAEVVGKYLSKGGES